MWNCQDVRWKVVVLRVSSHPTGHSCAQRKAITIRDEALFWCCLAVSYFIMEGFILLG